MELTKYVFPDGTIGFPNDTAVIAVTTHGAMHGDMEGIETFEVPEGMTITKFNVAPIGICNMASPEDSAKMATAISNAFSNNDPSKTLEDRLKEVLPKLKELQSEVVSRVNKKQPGVRPNELTREFIVYSDRSQTLKTYTEGQKMANKDYVKYPGEGTGDPYDFGMPILNKPGGHDLLQLLTTGHLGPATRSSGFDKEVFTKLSYIAGVLRWQMGVKHLVLFDYSCSSFYPMDPRTGRMVARRGIAEGLGGRKKTRRLKRKTKTRRGKKRTTQWKH